MQSRGVSPVLNPPTELKGFASAHKRTSCNETFVRVRFGLTCSCWCMVRQTEFSGSHRQAFSERHQDGCGWEHGREAMGGELVLS